MKGKGEAQVKGSKNSLIIHAKYALSPDQFVEGETKINILIEPGEKIWPVFSLRNAIPSLFLAKLTPSRTLSGT